MLARLKQSKIFSLSVKLGLSALALTVAFWDVNFVEMMGVLENQDHTTLLAAAALVVAQIIMGALRWQRVMTALAAKGEHVISMLQSFRLFYISVFFSACLVGTMGSDVVRAWLAKALHVPLPLAINSVIVDRIIALVALGVLVLVTLPMVGTAVGISATYVLPLALLAILGGFWFIGQAARLLAPYRHVRIVHWLLHFIGCLQLLLVHHKTTLVAIFYSAVAHFCYCLYAYVLAQGLGIDVTLLQCVILLPLVLLAVTLPISIGGWGVREVGLVGMFGLIGVPKAAALTLSIEMGLIGVVASLPGALLWLAHRRHVPPEAKLKQPSA